MLTGTESELHSALLNEPKANMSGFINLNLVSREADKSRMQLILNCPILLPEHFSTLQRKRKS